MNLKVQNYNNLGEYWAVDCTLHNKRCKLQLFYFKNIVHSVIHIILFVIMKNIYHPAVLILTVNSFNTSKQERNSIQLKKRFIKFEQII